MEVGNLDERLSLEEIQLNDKELRSLQRTLARYPLNLRIACEEIIAEQDVRLEQMVKLLKNLIKGVPAKETAVLAGEIQNKPITVPKNYTGKSGFIFIFFRKYNLVLRLIALTGIVAASIFYTLLS